MGARVSWQQLSMYSDVIINLGWSAGRSAGWLWRSVSQWPFLSSLSRCRRVYHRICPGPHTTTPPNR